LNKDPYLDRKVILPIVDGAPLTGGRSSRTSRHMLQLGLPGIDADHVEFRMQADGTVMVKPIYAAGQGQNFQ